MSGITKLAAVVLASCLAACATDTETRPAEPTEPMPRAKPTSSSATDVFTGEASYYAASLEGRATASGEPYRQANLTAAHRTLPFGTRLRVTNLKNGKSVIVTVNDRGPYSGNRVIDLSGAAAEEIDMIRDGVITVRVEVLG